MCDDDLMIGAEDGDSDWKGWYQFVAGTVHWRRPDASIGVLHTVPDGDGFVLEVSPAGSGQVGT